MATNVSDLTTDEQEVLSLQCGIEKFKNVTSKLQEAPTKLPNFIHKS